MFGSVARGCQGEHSDIDLVAVLPDLDYSARSTVQHRLSATASRASGVPVDVIVTDRAEWRIQREQVSCSFANAISGSLTALVDRTPSARDLAATRWNKDQVMATTNEQLAAERLHNTARMLSALLGLALPGRFEDALADTDPEEQAQVREARLITACANAHMAIENALKAVGTIAEIAPQLLWRHDVGEIADAVSDAVPHDGPALRALLHQAPELVRAPGYITMWRTVGVYGTVGDGMTAAEVATPQFTSALLVIAADIADAAARWLGHRGLRTADTDAVRQRAQSVRDIASLHDLGTGEPLNHLS